MIKQESIERVKGVSLVKVAVELFGDHLQNRGGLYTMCCPFHTEKTPSFFIYNNERSYKCHGCGEYGNVINFVMKRNKWDESRYPEAVKLIADLDNITLEYEEDTPENKAKWEAYKKKCDIIQDVQEYCECLLWDENPADANVLKVREYLLNRYGYDKLESEEERTDLIKQLRLQGFGYLANREQLRQYLISKGYDTNDLNASLINCISQAADPNDESKEVAENKKPTFWSKSNEIDKQHNLVIPIYRYGKLVDFVYRWVRRTDADTEPDDKYLKVGKKRWGYVFDYIQRNKSMTLVEGQFDALTAAVYGIDNVAAIATNKLREDAIKDAIDHGVKAITLCLDSDATDKNPDKNRENNEKAINKMLGVIRQQDADVRLYVATLPSEDPSVKVDPHDYIVKNGAEAFKKVIHDAKLYYKAQCDIAAGRLITAAQANDGDVADTDLETYWKNVCDTYNGCLQQSDREGLKDAVIASWNNYDGISRETIEAKFREIADKQEQEATKARVEKLIKDAEKAIANGDTARAQLLMQEATKQNNALSEYEEHRELILQPRNNDWLYDAIMSEKPDLEVGLNLTEYKENAPKTDLSNHTITHPLTFPSGQVSFIVGKPSHGKTAILTQMAYNAAMADSSRNILFLSNEQSEQAITLRLLAIDGNQTRGDIKKAIKNGTRPNASNTDRLLSNRNIIIRYVGSMSANEIAQLIKDANKILPNLRGVFFDYIQYMHADPKVRKFDNRTNELKLIAEMMLDAATETTLPIIMGAQFTREVETPDDVTFERIAESSDIEKVGNVIVGIYDMDADVKKNKQDDNVFVECTGISYSNGAKNGKLWCKILKSRDGERNVHGMLEFSKVTGVIRTLGEENQATEKDNEEVF